MFTPLKSASALAHPKDTKKLHATNLFNKWNNDPKDRKQCIFSHHLDISFNTVYAANGYNNVANKSYHYMYRK